MTERGAPFGTLRGYERAWVRADVVAALTVWAVLVPESLAYATIAGVSPVVGLYAAVMALVAYAALGSSRLLVAGPISETAALSAAVVADVAGDGSPERFAALTAALAVGAGAAGMLAGVARLGFLATFISAPVLKGFIVGVALTILVGQVPKIIGVEAADGGFLARCAALLGDFAEADLTTLGVGAASLTAVLGLRRVAPLVPAALVAVVAGIAAVAVLGLEDRGVEVVGPISAGLPSFALPGDASDYGALAAGAVAMMLVGFVTGLGAASAYERDGIAANRELVAVGTANVASGLAGGMVVGGSLSKTAINASAGGRTQLSGLVVAALTVVTLLFLTGLFEQLPEATLAAIVVAAVVELVDVRALRRLFGAAAGAGRMAARPDFVAAVAALLGVLVFGTLVGLFLGIGVSLTLLLYRASRPPVTELARAAEGGRWVARTRHPASSPVPGVVVLRVEGGLFFANAQTVRDALRGAAGRQGTRAVVLDAATVPFVDVTASAMLTDVADELTRAGVRFAVAGEIGPVRELVQRASPTRFRASRHADVPSAVAAVACDSG